MMRRWPLSRASCRKTAEEPSGPTALGKAGGGRTVWQNDEIEAFVSIAVVGLSMVVGLLWWLA
jgi:hypothetical protein